MGENAAALAYYLIFAVFPLLIFISNLVGLLQLDITEITGELAQFLPDDVVQLIETYLEYVSHTSSRSLLWFSLVFSVCTPLRAAKGLMKDVRLAFNMDKPENYIKYAVSQFLYTVVLLAVFSITLFVSTFGRKGIRALISFLPYGTVQLSAFFLKLWNWRRFIIAAVFMYIALGTLYSLSVDKKLSLRSMMPGIAAALSAWVILSVGFSFYVENFADYSVIYGALGAVMVLLVWLYMSAVILIMGAELNAALLEIRGTEENNRDV